VPDPGVKGLFSALFHARRIVHILMEFQSRIVASFALHVGAVSG
jgi:hypothetical protein